MTTMPKFVAIDVETTLNGNEEVGLAHPMHPDNRVVAWGIHKDYAFYTPETTYTEAVFEALVEACVSENTICGHNLAFDLM